MTSTTTSSSSSVLLESEPIPLQMSGVVTMGHGGLEQLVWRTDLPVPSLEEPLACFVQEDSQQQCALAQVPLVLVKVLAAGACVCLKRRICGFLVNFCMDQAIQRMNNYSHTKSCLFVIFFAFTGHDSFHSMLILILLTAYYS